MSVYNRKMFKRNARNALNQSAGVQNFRLGGQVGSYQTFTDPTSGRTYGGISPSSGGVRSLQPFSLAQRYLQGGRSAGYGRGSAISPGEFAALQAYESANMAGRRIKDPTGTRIGGVFESVLNPAGRVAAGGGAFARSLASSATQGILGSGKEGDATFGDRVSSMRGPELDRDFLADQGIAELIDARNMQTASSRGRGFPVTRIPEGGMAADRIKQEQLNRNTMDNSPEAIARREAEAEARKQMEEQGIVFSDQETGKVGDKSETEFMAGLIMDDIQAAQQDQRKEDEYLKAVEAADRDEADVDLAEYKKEEDKSGDGASGGGGQEGGDAAPSAKEEIERVINSGTQEEQEKTLDGFIKEFMDKAPGYEGADSGLVLAKIGFAMAAGKSPNAIENIASAMSDGADMLIKDKAKRDEFDRQLKLSAMQYGLTETSKLRAQERLDDRNFLSLVDKDGKPARISMTELMANDGKIPEGLLDKDVYLAQEKAALERIKNVNAQTKALRSELLLTDEAARKIQGDYGKEAKRYIDAEVGIEFTEKALLNIADDGSVVGLKGGAKDLANRLANAGGIDLGTSFETKAEFEANVRQAFQKLIPVSLAGVQSANSISNRDVQFLADAYIESAILEGGVFNLAMIDEDVLAKKLGGVINEFRRNQALAAGNMRGIEERLTNRILPGQGQGSAVTLLAESKKSLEPFGVGQRTTSGLVDTGEKNSQGMPIFKLPSAG